jgi:ornithine cyclodeaminase
MRRIDADEIRRLLPGIDLLPRIEAAFAAHSAGRSVVPPVGELLFRDPPGDVHIKYGYLEGERYYVVKIASGFYDNPRLGLPSGDGLMLLFEQRTGEPAALLLDRGYLTDVRTAVAGAIAARHLAPPAIDRIGIVGTGVQARLQLEYLRGVTACREALVWGRSAERADAFCADLASSGFHVERARDLDTLAAGCALIVTATPSTAPLLRGAALRPGTHVTAVGADTAAKRELDSEVFRRADVVVADSIEQCRTRGELHHALDDGAFPVELVVELGEVIAGKARGRRGPLEITIADLTGVAVQDVAIAAAVLEAAEGAAG